MNRQYKRMMKKEEERKRSAPRPTKAPGAPTRKERTKPTQFAREVGAEMRKVDWPSRQEVFSYSLVVLVAALVVAALVFGMDFVFTRAVLALFGVES